MSITVTRKGYVTVKQLDGTLVDNHADWDKAMETAANMPDGSEVEVTMVKRVKVSKPASAPAPSPAPEPAPPAVARPGLNLAGIGYYQSVYPYIDLVKNGGGWASANWPARPFTLDPDGWPTLNPGDSLRLNVAMHMGSWAYVPPGDYKIVSTSPATLGLHKDSGVLNKTSGVGLATFTVQSPADVIVEVTNQTQLPIELRDIAVYRVDHEPLLKAGKVFRPDFLEQLKNCKVIRTLDWTEANNSGAISAPEHIPTEKRISWARPCPSVFGRLVNELRAIGADPELWVTTPVGSYSSRYSSANGVIEAAHRLSEGEPVMFLAWGTPPAGVSKGVRYFARDVTPTTFRVASEPGGPAIAIGDSTLDWGRRVGSLKHSIPEIMEAYFAAIHSTCPTAKIIAEATNEPWNTAFTQSHWLSGPGAYLAGSSSSIGHGYAWLSLQVWKAAEKFFPTAKRVVNGQAANFSAMRSMFDYIDPGIIKAGSRFGDLIHLYAAAPYAYLLDDAGKEVPVSAALSATDAQILAWLENGTTKAASRMATTKAELAKVSKATLTSYESGHHVFHQGSLQGVGEWGKRFQSLLDSVDGLNWAKDYRERVFIANGVSEMVWFTSAGYWVATDSAVQQWGIRPGLRDTQISTWFKGL